MPIYSSQVVVYSRSIKCIHWIVAVMVIALLLFSFFLDDVPKPYQGLAFILHKSMGLTVLALMLCRLCMVFYQKKPLLPTDLSVFERRLALLVHHSFYVFLILMPLTGWIMSVAAGRVPSYFGLFAVPFPGIPIDSVLSHTLKETHKIIAWILIGLVSLHVLGALKHHFIDKDGLLFRMLPQRKRGR